MIEIFEGRLGGGKTYSAVLRIVNALTQGVTVATNVSLIWTNVKDHVRSNYSLELDDRQFIAITDQNVAEFHRNTPDDCLIVLDEVQLWHNARDWAQTSRDLLNFLTQSRKYKTDVIFISQSAENIDKQFRRLIQFVWRFRDMSKWTIPGIGLGWPLQQILQIKCDYDAKTVLERSLIMKDKKIFALYDTNAVYQSRFERMKLDERGKPKKLKKKKMKLIMWVAIIAALAGFGIYTFKEKNPIANAQKQAKEIKKQTRSDAVQGSGHSPVPQKNPVAIAIVANASTNLIAEMIQDVEGDIHVLKDGIWYYLGAETPRGRVIARSGMTFVFSDGSKVLFSNSWL